MKKLLIIINPNSGTKRANKFLTDIVSIFNAADWECTVYATKARGDGTKLVIEHGPRFDMVVCIGGDGTFNEILSGTIRCGKDLPIGYIPAGSTNDFASGIGLPKNILKAAAMIAEGMPRSIDAGQFDARHFAYVASFGAFAKTSYSTPQNIKNTLGHVAYYLEGIKDLTTLHPEHVRIEVNGHEYEDDYIFGSVSNATCVGGGVLMLDSNLVDLNDGQLEVLLIRAPKNVMDLNECLRALQTRNYNNDMFHFFSAEELTVYASKAMDWTLDGEHENGHEKVVIKTLPSAYRLMM